MAIRQYCQRCRAVKAKGHKHRAPDNRPGPRRRGYGPDWERTRAIYLQQCPFCHFHNCRQYATQVHHLDGQGPQGPRGHDFGNLQGLCHSHHSHITAKEHGFNATG
jgi:hypothetical protein